MDKQPTLKEAYYRATLNFHGFAGDEYDKHFGGRLCYRVLLDAVYAVLSDFTVGRSSTAEDDHKWLFSREYSKQVTRLGGMSSDLCCDVLDLDLPTLQHTVASILSDKQKYNQESVFLITNLYNYNSIYNNITTT